MSRSTSLPAASLAAMTPRTDLPPIDGTDPMPGSGAAPTPLERRVAQLEKRLAEITGADPDARLSLEETAKRIGRSPSRVRQILNSERERRRWRFDLLFVQDPMHRYYSRPSLVRRWYREARKAIDSRTRRGGALHEVEDTSQSATSRRSIAKSTSCRSAEVSPAAAGEREGEK